jgi:transcription antitermination factor NusG
VASAGLLRFGHGGARVNSGGARAGAGRPRNPVPLLAPIGLRWFVYLTHPQAEGLAARELSRSGYRSYSPLIAVRRQDPVIATMFHKVLAPRFLRYGFVELGPTDPWLPIVHDTPGVAGMLLRIGGHRPAPVKIDVVELHMADDDRLCDLARETMPKLDKDARVTIEAGALAGFAGVVVDCDGLVTTVQVRMFGRLMTVRVDRASVVEIVLPALAA